MAFIDGGIEVLPTSAGTPAAIHLRERSNRLKAFFGTFILVATIGLAYTWLRSPVYESKAILQVSYLQQESREKDAFFLEQLVIHQQRLSSRRMMVDLATRLAENNVNAPNSDHLLELLNATMLTDSRLIELSAIGETPQRLVDFLQQWVQLYLEQFQSDQTQDNQTEIAGLKERLEKLEGKVSDKRGALDQYKQQFKIVSVERDENRTIAKVKAIGASLDKASEEWAKAAAIVESIRKSISNGKEVVRPEDQRSLNILKRDALALQEQLRGHAENFTPKFMEIDPRMLALKRNLDLLETKVLAQQKISSTLYLEDSERDLAVAFSQRRQLQKDLDNYQSIAQEFSSNLNRFNAMSLELEELEAFTQSLRNRLVNEQVNDPHETRVDLLETPFVALEPISPDYMRDTGISLGVAFLCALLSILIYSLLNPRQRPELIVNTHSMIRDIPSLSMEPLEGHTPHALHESTAEKLTHQLGDALTPEECSQLIRVSNPPTRLAIKLLLSGVDNNELLQLKWDQWKDVDQQSTLALEHDRVLSLPPSVAESVRHCMERTTGADQYVLMNAQREALNSEALNTMVNLAAYDAGIVEPERVDVESLQHTYCIYLLQQGVRLGELERYVGPLKPEVIRQYRTYASPSAAENRDEIDTLYPALKSA